MAQRNSKIEESFNTIAPSRRRGIPNPGTISEGITGNNGDPTASLSEAAQQIAQLRETYQQQSDLIQANTQALQNSASQSGHSTASTVGGLASSLFGGALGLISPIISGLTQLFGGGAAAPVTLPVYTPPPPVSIGGILHAPTSQDSTPAGGEATSSQGSTGGNQTTYSPQITVNVSAMDSQSFMDRSSDIASAVREAMLNNHPINGVVTDL